MKELRYAGLATSRTASVRLTVRSWIVNSPWWRIALVSLTGVALCAVLALASGLPWWWGAATGAALSLLVWFAAWSPEGLKSVLALLAAAPFTFVFGYVFVVSSSTTSQTATTEAGVGAVGLLFGLLLVTFGSARWGRGRSWVTVLLAAVSVVFPGILLLAAVPSLSLWAAWIPMLLVAALRWGWWSYVASWIAWFRRRKDALPRVPQFRDVTGAASVSLSRVPDGVALVSAAGIVGAVVVTPKGRVEESQVDGVAIPDVDASLVAVRALRAARRTARLAGKTRRSVTPAIVLTGKWGGKVDRLVSLHVDREDAVTAVVRIVSAEVLARELQPPPTRRVHRIAALVTARNARQRAR